MGISNFFKAGRLFFAIAAIAIGIIHLVTGNFPTGFEPIPASFAGKIVLVYLTGTALICAGVLILTKKYAKWGSILSVFVFLLLTLLIQIPKSILTFKDAGGWVTTFEGLSFFSGSLILAGFYIQPNVAFKSKASSGYKWVSMGCYIFAVCLLAFCAIHLVYEDYIITLIPKWLPFPKFWFYVTTIGFFGAALSLLIRKLVRVSLLLLALMFFIWVLILHGPLVITHIKVEPQWTSLFVALTMGAVSIMIVGSTDNKHLRD